MPLCFANRTARQPTLAVALCVAALAMPGDHALAQGGEVKTLGSFGDWTAYQVQEGSTVTCYMAARPAQSQGNYSRRGEIFALVTHRPAEGSRNTFSFVTGYSYKPDSQATLTIDAQRFTLFTQGDTAWAADQATDDAIAAAIKKGNRMTVKGTSSRGTETTDTVSLRGSTAAHDAIGKSCGVR